MPGDLGMEPLFIESETEDAKLKLVTLLETALVSGLVVDDIVFPALFVE